MIKETYKKTNLVEKTVFSRSSSTAKKPYLEKANVFLIFKEKLEAEWGFRVSDRDPETKKKTNPKKNAIVNKNPVILPINIVDCPFEDPDFEPAPWKRAVLDEEDD